MLSAQLHLITGLLATVGACATARVPRSQEPSVPGSSEVVGEIRAAVERVSDQRQVLGMTPFQFLPDSVSFLRESSTAVAGMIYEWGTYQPPGTYDVLFTAVAAHRRGQNLVLRSPPDWGRVATAEAWRDATAQRAERACREIVEYTGPRRDIGIRPRVYVGPSSVSNLFAADRDSLLRLGIESPQVTGGRRSGEWSVTFWAIESGQTTRYRCMLGPGDSTSLAVVDSIYGLGFQPRGP